MNDNQSDHSDASSDDEFLMNLHQKIAEMDHTDEKSSRIISKNEIITKPIIQPIQETKEERQIRFNVDLNEVRLQNLGRIELITKDTIIIQSLLLEFVVQLDQVVLTEQNEIIGKVDDVIGKVEKPHYSIVIDSYANQLIVDGHLKVGTVVFVDIAHTNVLNLMAIKDMMQKKGCDASNQFDEEVLMENEINYSDDESEMQSKSNKKHKNKKPQEDGEIQLNKQHKQHIQQQKQQQQQKPIMNNTQFNQTNQQSLINQQVYIQQQQQQQQQYQQQMQLQLQLQLQQQQYPMQQYSTNDQQQYIGMQQQHIPIPTPPQYNMNVPQSYQNTFQMQQQLYNQQQQQYFQQVQTQPQQPQQYMQSMFLPYIQQNPMSILQQINPDLINPKDEQK